MPCCVALVIFISGVIPLAETIMRLAWAVKLVPPASSNLKSQTMKNDRTGDSSMNDRFTSI